MTFPEPFPAGTVALVGAGPGDPGLITLRGTRLLGEADVVVYDYLSNPALLQHCPQAECVYVGKKGPQHALPQEQINQLLIDKARSGKRVVRLKGGDPFVFGRGGEECLALAEAAVGFTVVPGITAAIAAPAYAGIPVTHRDFNSSFTLITGHEKEDAYKDPAALARAAAEDEISTAGEHPQAGGPATGESPRATGAGGKGSSDIDWAAIAKLPCVAFYMGVKALPRICENLIAHGLSPHTPAATIQWGTTPRQRTVTATLATLPHAILAAGVGSPAITIVGRVVELPGRNPALSWFERRPLFGQTVIVTRTRDQQSELGGRLEMLGANVLEAPTIEIAPPDDWTEVDTALADVRAGNFDWLIFTSASGVRLTRQRMRQIGADARLFARVRVAAVGDATAEAVSRELALEVDCVPAQFLAEALAAELVRRGEVAGRRFMLLRADIARPLLVEKLQQAAAAVVRDVNVYQTRIARELPPHVHAALEAGEVDWITFTSSSTARNFTALLGDHYAALLQKVRRASIGPVTTQTLVELGLPPTVQATESDIAGLVDAVLRGGGGEGGEESRELIVESRELRAKRNEGC